MITFKALRRISEVVLLGLVSFAFHTIIFHALGKNEAGFHYSLLELYGFFLICSTAIICILAFIKQKNIDNVGYAFLLLTCLKMGGAYILLRPILDAGRPGLNFEKATFFIVFSVFLAIETLATIRLLNKSQ